MESEMRTTRLYRLDTEVGPLEIRQIDPEPSPAPRLITEHGVLFHEDCLHLLRRIRSDSIQCIFADPPFNLGKAYQNGFVDELESSSYLAWCFEWIDECIRVLSTGGAFFLYSMPKWAYHLAHHLDSAGLDLRHWIALSMK